MESERQLITDKAALLYEINHHEGTSKGNHYDYTCPSPFFYPHQWKWDSAFHAVVLRHLDPERAKREIETLFLRQREDGFVPCVNIWEKRHPLEEFLYIDKITQPPVLPIAVEQVYDKTGDRAFVANIYPKLKKAGEWLAGNRDRNSNGLLEIIHPWEDGDDRNPSFDKQLGIKKSRLNPVENFYVLFKILAKYSRLRFDEDAIYKSKTFIAETALFNSIFALSNLSMAHLSLASGHPEDFADFNSKYERVKNAMLRLMWNPEDKIFYDLGGDSEQSHVKSISSLMPLILPDLPPEIYKPLIEDHLLNPREYWTPLPVASVSQKEPSFRAGANLELWRGPAWVNTNWFLTKALLNYGYEKAAKELTHKTVEAVKQSGFREFYNPYSFEGYGQKNFGWSTLVLDMLLLL